MHSVVRGYSELPVKDSNLTAQWARNSAATESNQNDAASSSHVWLTDAKLSERARKLAAVYTSQGLNFPESARTLVAENLDIHNEDDSK